MSFQKILIIGLSILSLIGCASEEEKRERRENAFDISGEYSIEKGESSDVSIDFVIENESGRHDIKITLNRLDDFSDKEKLLIQRKGLDLNKVKEMFAGKSLVLGAGYNAPASGGENYSDDFGDTSKFYVCTEKKAYNKEVGLSYCLSGTISRKSKTLTGSFSLNYLKDEEITNEKGEKSRKLTSDNTRLDFNMNLSMVFYKQYLGVWSGEIYKIDSGDLNLDTFKNFIISETADGNYEFGLSSRISFSFEGKIFTYDVARSQRPISLLKEHYYPTVQAVYVSDNPEVRIKIIGQFWSLGDFKGSILYITKNTERELASFQFKKD